MVGVILLAICISISAVSADDGWSFNFSSSDSSNSNGGSVNIDNNKLTIQGLTFTIPDGYKEDESYRVVGEDANQSSFQGAKISTVKFVKENDSIIIKTVFGDQKYDKDGYTPDTNAVSKKIADEDGFFNTYNDGVSFTYFEDGKIVEIFAPDENVIQTLISSSSDK